MLGRVVHRQVRVDHGEIDVDELVFEAGPARLRAGRLGVQAREADRKPLTAAQEVRLVGEPATAELEVLPLAPGKQRQRIHVTLAAMKAPRYRATQTAIGSAIHRAILDATRNLGAAVSARRDPHDLERGNLVATNGVYGWFEGNLPQHVPTHPRHRRRRRRPGCLAIKQIPGFSRSKRARRKRGDGYRDRRPGGSRN